VISVKLYPQDPGFRVRFQNLGTLCWIWAETENLEAFIYLTEEDAKNLYRALGETFEGTRKQASS